MRKSRLRPPSMTEICEAWPEIGIEEGICFACGSDKRLEKAHIVPHSWGGSNSPRNYFILCHFCHKRQPDIAPLDVQLAWLRTQPTEMDRVWPFVTAAAARPEDATLVLDWEQEWRQSRAS